MSQPTRQTRPRLGVLACDRIWEPHRSRHGDYAQMYAALLERAGAVFELVEYAAHEGVLPSGPDECDGWLYSGSRASVYEPLPWIPPLMAFVRTAFEAGVPQVGVCFGHQLLAQALGGQVSRAAGWGLGNFEITRHEGAGMPLRLLMAHQDQVVQLPPGAVCLGSAPHCPIALFRVDDRVLGLQPHPEFTPAFLRDITQENSFGLPAALASEALASCAHAADSDVPGAWIAAFLKLPQA